MAEFVEKRCEEMIPELEQMERIKLMDKSQTRAILKKRKDYEYKLERHTKCKEDYLNYINYELKIFKFVHLRRKRFGITQKKSHIDYAIKQRVNRLYNAAIRRFGHDFSLFRQYLLFCKEYRMESCAGRILPRMTQLHPKKEECWFIAANWQKKEAKNLINAKAYLSRGLLHNKKSSLLYLERYKLELEDEASTADSGEISNKFRRSNVVYEEAVKNVNDLKFIVDLLNLTKNYENTESLQLKIINDLRSKYEEEPLVWDVVARRELEGLPNSISSDNTMEVNSTEQKSLRDRIISCNEVYRMAVEKLKNEEMWSLYIDCLVEICGEKKLPNLKIQLLKSALSKGHEAKMLTEEHYLYWIGLLNRDEKLAEVFCWATEALPNSVKLWHERLRYLLENDTEESAAKVLTQAAKVLEENSLSLWKLKLQHVRTKKPEKIEEFFQKACYVVQTDVRKAMKTAYLEWAAENKDIHEIREIYKSIYLLPPSGLELHKKMIEIEIMQPEIDVKKVRECYQIAIMQVEKTDMDIWMDYAKFEMKHGDPFQAPKIYARAVKTLIAPLSDKFIAEYSMLKARPASMNMPHKSESL